MVLALSQLFPVGTEEHISVYTNCKYNRGFLFLKWCLTWDFSQGSHSKLKVKLSIPHSGKTIPFSYSKRMGTSKIVRNYRSKLNRLQLGFLLLLEQVPCRRKKTKMNRRKHLYSQNLALCKRQIAAKLILLYTAAKGEKTLVSLKLKLLNLLNLTY